MNCANFTGRDECSQNVQHRRVRCYLLNTKKDCVSIRIA